MQIGKIKIDNPLILAPMEEVTDKAFRLICKEMGADIVYTEFISSDAIIRDIKKITDKLIFSEKERPIGIQLYGNNEELISKAVSLVEIHKPDFIDINCGCWARKHVARGEGAALLKDLIKYEKIITAAAKTTKIPVTVKTRLGWDEKNIVIIEAAKIAQNAGAKAISVHCRTRNQGYKGKADWSWLEKIRKEISIPLIANGDIVSPEDVKKLLEYGCDGFMIGRGAIANPFIFKEIKHYLATGIKLPPSTLKEKVDLCLKHLQLSIQLKGTNNAIFPFRKFYNGYFHGVPNISNLRKELMWLKDFDNIVKCLNKFLEQQ